MAEHPYIKTHAFKSKTPLAKAIALSALGMMPFNTSAELVSLDETQLSMVRGQAGLTIDIETKYTIGEFEYVDAGSMFIRGMSLGGINGGYLDNLRARVDISDGSEYLLAGFADMAMLATMGKLDSNEADVAWALNEYVDGAGNLGKQIGDGDLLIHVSSVDYGIDLFSPEDPAEYAANLAATKNAVDLKVTESEFGLRSSDGLVETVLTSNFSVEAYLGYLDIHITNDGNGQHEGASDGEPEGILIGDSYIGFDVKFRVEDLDVDNTNNATNTFISRNVTQPGLTLRDFRIHNERGLDTLGSFGYASVKQKWGSASNILPGMDVLSAAPTSTAERVDGMAIYDINVRWDWDLPHIQFGDTDTSIGEVYLTDFIIYDTSIVMSAH
jgi:uncharacterized protein DUF6160